jgi:methionyl aminopeptidase
LLFAFRLILAAAVTTIGGSDIRRRSFSFIPCFGTAPLARKAPIYSREEDRNSLRNAARFNAQMMDFIRPYMQPGVTTGEIDRLVYGYTMEHGHTPACLGYQGFPRTICASVNEVVCHGIPGDRRLKSGDIVNVDLTTIVNGWYGDSSETFMIGDVSPEARRLVQVTFDAMWVGIRAIKPHGRVADIGKAIYRFARAHRFEVVREYQGHGIGRDFHQEPGVPHYPTAKSARDIVKPGVCLTIEPMLNEGVWRTSEGQGGRLDGPHGRREAVGAVRAHDPDDRGRPRGAHGDRKRPAGRAQVLRGK